MGAVLIFDADNTLWDTNSVFRDAQLSLLRVLADTGLLTDPEAEFDTLRALDRELIRQHGRFEYDFKLLSAAAATYYSEHPTIEDAARSAVEMGVGISISSLSELIHSAYSAYARALEAIPALYPDTSKALDSIRELRRQGLRIACLVFSEGNANRLERILQAHQIRRHGYFDRIVIAVKSVEAFERARRAGLRLLGAECAKGQALAVFIGDSLKRDIALANRAGFTTVYKPALFFGTETPEIPEEEPDYKISSLSELPNLLGMLGLR